MRLPEREELIEPVVGCQGRLRNVWARPAGGGRTPSGAGGVGGEVTTGGLSEQDCWEALGLDKAPSAPEDSPWSVRWIARRTGALPFQWLAPFCPLISRQGSWVAF